jgi:hypothetical protein
MKEGYKERIDRPLVNIGGYQQLNFASLGAGDIERHRLGIWVVRIRLPNRMKTKTPIPGGFRVGGIGLEPTTSSV